MPREQIAGGIIVDQLRDRILSGMYLGRWRPGERLPSIRDVADAERVDRKTAAAAYRRLQVEGLVDVRARSGVYLREEDRPQPHDPLQRLERQWLENTYHTGQEIGLDTQAMIRVIGCVAAVERRPVPVIEGDWSQAEALAGELRERLGIRTVTFLSTQLDPRDRVLAEAPFLITTPFQHPHVVEVANGRRIVQLILARDILEQIGQLLASGPVLIVAASEEVALKIKRAIDRALLLDPAGNASITVPSDPERLFEAASEADCVFLWPGSPGWVVRHLETLDCVIPARCIASESLSAARSAVLDCAMRLVGRSNGGEPLSMSSGAALRAKTAALE